MIDKINEEVFIDIEKKRLKYIDNLTLAQRLGIVDKPPEPLSTFEWKSIEHHAFELNQDSCSICLEKF